jgi:hypothetical protein
MWTTHEFVDCAMKKLNITMKISEDLITFLAPHGCLLYLMLSMWKETAS